MIAHDGGAPSSGWGSGACCCLTHFCASPAHGRDSLLCQQETASAVPGSRGDGPLGREGYESGLVGLWPRSTGSQWTARGRPGGTTAPPPTGGHRRSQTLLTDPAPELGRRHPPRPPARRRRRASPGLPRRIRAVALGSAAACTCAAQGDSHVPPRRRARVHARQARLTATTHVSAAAACSSPATQPQQGIRLSAAPRTAIRSRTAGRGRGLGGPPRRRSRQRRTPFRPAAAALQFKLGRGRGGGRAGYTDL